MAGPMTEPDTVELACAAGVIPVIPALEIDRVDPLGDALKSAGLPVAEVTLRSANAFQMLKRFAADRELLVGAGTVVRPDQVELAAEAGARFIVTPGISERVIRRCHQFGLPVIPGVSTPTEIISALDLGCHVLKFFPAQASGGVAMIAALEGPFPDLRFVPTGGVTGAERICLSQPALRRGRRRELDGVTRTCRRGRLRGRREARRRGRRARRGGSLVSDLEIRSSDSCCYDLVSLGEVMLRLDPGEGRIRNAALLSRLGRRRRVQRRSRLAPLLWAADGDRHRFRR